MYAALEKTTPRSSFFHRLNTTQRYLVAIVFLAALLRFGWVLYAQTIPGSDFTQYELLARRLAEGQGYVDEAGEATAFYAIGWPFFLSLFYRVFEPTFIIAGLINSFMATASVILTYAISRFLLDRRTALIATLLVAINPTLILYTSTHGTESLFILQMLLMAWLAMRVLMGSETTGRHTIGAHPVELILIGVVAGLAILTRPVAICMLASIFIGFYVMDRHDLRRNFLKISLITVTAAVIVVPWAVRNTVAVGATTLQTSSGVVLWIGHNPQATGALMPPPHIPGINAGARPGAGPNATEAEANAAYTSAAIDSFLNNPFRALTLVPRKMFELWGGHRHAVSHSTRKSERAIPGVILDILPILTQGYLVLLLLLVIAAFGIKQSLMRWLKGSGVILTGTFVGWNVYHAMNFGSGRYHVPLEPILAIFAASAISAIILTTKNSAPNS